ncbi:MAG: serine protease, partial [Aestuariibaculum sp.]
MNFKYITLLVLIIGFLGCNSNQNQQPVTEIPVSTETVMVKNEAPKHSSVYVNGVTSKAEKLLSANNYTPFGTLQTQKLDRIEESSEITVQTAPQSIKTGNQMYNHLQESTMYIGSSYLCGKCPNVHLTHASGFVIHEKGVIVTNYHVIEVKEGVDVSAIFAADNEGNVYPVSKILSASQSNDIAILQLDTKGKTLKALPFAQQEIVGEDVFAMGHPFNNTFFITKGIVAQKYISEHSGEPKIAITANFGQGASGGPVVNNKGEVVGVISATYMHYTNGSKSKGDLQLVV